MEIDDRFIDVDFTREEAFVAGDLGMMAMASAPPFYDEREELVPESRWQELSDMLDESNAGLEWLVTRIYNQGREGSCVGNAACQAMEVVQAMQAGKDAVVPLSAISLYKRIGRSPSSGAYVPDALEEGQSRGVLPLDTPENRAKYGAHVMPHTGFHTPWPAGWESTAAKLKIGEAPIHRSLASLVSAGFKGHPAIVGRDGHSICYLRPKYRNGQLGFLYVNSWGPWGFGAGGFSAGFGWDSLRMVQQSARWAFSIRSFVIH